MAEKRKVVRTGSTVSRLARIVDVGLRLAGVLSLAGLVAGATLEGRQLKDTFANLLQVDNNNAGLDATLRAIEDGKGNASGVLLSTGGLGVDVISEKTAANGVAVDGVNLKDGGATLNTAGGTDALLGEIGIDRSSGSAESFNIQNSGAGAMTLNVDGIAVPTVSSTSTLTNKTLTSPTINGGTISGIADLAVADGGTGASTAAGARTNLGLDNGVLLNIQVFTSSGTWTPTSGTNAVKVIVVGAGGGGGGAGGGGNVAGGGGGGGGACVKYITSGLGATETVTVGSGGAGGTSAGTSGSSGGTSSFGAHCSATGGSGGAGDGGSGTPYGGAGGAGGAGSSGTFNVGGQGGMAGIAQSSLVNPGGGGSGAYLAGGGAPGRRGTGAGAVGAGYGGGGSGAGGAGTGAAGGAGADGVVIVWEYE